MSNNATFVLQILWLRRHLDARKVRACTENCFYYGITEGDGEEAGDGGERRDGEEAGDGGERRDGEEAGDELLALTATSPPNTDGYLMK